MLQRMVQRIENINTQDVFNKIFFVSGLIVFIMALAIIAINLILTQTLVIPFYDFSPFVSLGLLIMHIWWVSSLISCVLKKKTE
jgi:hypothetical protein